MFNDTKIAGLYVDQQNVEFLVYSIAFDISNGDRLVLLRQHFGYQFPYTLIPETLFYQNYRRIAEASFSGIPSFLNGVQAVMGDQCRKIWIDHDGDLVVD